MQSKFLPEIIAKLESNQANEVIEKFEKLRKIIVDPSNVILYLAGNLDILKDANKPIERFLPNDLQTNVNKQP